MLNWRKLVHMWPVIVICHSCYMWKHCSIHQNSDLIINIMGPYNGCLCMCVCVCEFLTDTGKMFFHILCRFNKACMIIKFVKYCEPVCFCKDVCILCDFYCVVLVSDIMLCKSAFGLYHFTYLCYQLNHHVMWQSTGLKLSTKQYPQMVNIQLLLPVERTHMAVH